MKTKKSPDAFIFESYDINSISKEIHFNYRISGGATNVMFTERLVFPKEMDWIEHNNGDLDHILQTLHIILGISYWKLYCPKKIILKEIALDKRQAHFFNKVYTLGLGEFFYKNKIDFRKLISFPVSSRVLPTTHYKLQTKNRSLLLFGGGKDSFVSAELLKRAKKDFTYFSVITGGGDALRGLLPKGSIVVERFLDRQLFELNTKSRVYRGHIPVSAILACIGELAAILYGYRYVIASNEKSANYGNVRYFKTEINHQWSKSMEFERMFQEYSHKYITASITYFSLLRPIYEIKIIEIFSRLGRRYFNKFSSCNTNFKILPRGKILPSVVLTKDGSPSFARASEGRSKRIWCLDCPKCAFVFTMMAAFVPKKEMVRIFGGNMFEKKELLNIFRELLGLRKIKPFECVGTPEEMNLAVYMIKERGEYKNDYILRILGSKIKKPDKVLINKLLGVSSDHLISDKFNAVIKSI